MPNVNPLDKELLAASKVNFYESLQKPVTEAVQRELRQTQIFPRTTSRAPGRLNDRPEHACEDEPDERSPAPSGRDLRRGIVRLSAAAAVVLVLVLALPGLGAVRSQLAHGTPGWLALAACFRVGSALAFVVAFAAVLALFALKRSAVASAGTVAAKATATAIQPKTAKTWWHFAERSSQNVPGS
jgi:hypothetical protein